MWILFAISGYFLTAIVFSIDKLILETRIQKPAVYAFWVAFFSLFILIFIPFGFSIPPIEVILISILGGIIFTYSLLALYSAISKSDISQVAPLSGAITALLTGWFSFIFIEGAFTFGTFVPFLLLIMGSFIISCDFRSSRVKFFQGFYYTLIASVLTAMALIIFKYAYSHQNFMSGFIWSRIGLFLGGVSLLFFKPFRKEIWEARKTLGKFNKSNFGTGFIFIINKVIAGTGTLLINYAIFLGPVVYVQSLSSLQYIFVLLIAFFLSCCLPNIFHEKLRLRDWLQRLVAIIFIALGIIILVRSGVELLY